MSRLRALARAVTISIGGMYSGKKLQVSGGIDTIPEDPEACRGRAALSLYRNPSSKKNVNFGVSGQLPWTEIDYKVGVSLPDPGIQLELATTFRCRKSGGEEVEKEKEKSI